MNPNKEINRNKSKEVFKNNGIAWKSFNQDNHWKIGRLDFFPTTLKWLDQDNNKRGEGIEEFINYATKPTFTYFKKENELSVQDLVKIAMKVKPQNLMSICEAIHKEIYK